MNRFRRRSMLMTMCSVLLLKSTVALAQTVRGRIVRNGQFGHYPVAGIQVTLDRRVAAVTGSDGMYYFGNVPPGRYTLEVWLGPGQAIALYIDVAPDPTDVVPIVVP